MITLKEALKLNKDELMKFRLALKEKIEKERSLGAYVEQLLGSKLSELGDGIPIAIKDNIQVKGWSVTSASKILQGYVAPYNATVIEKLIESGFAPFGRTNMDEFAMGNTTQTSFYGKTLNPTDHSRVPGGSSGGSAAAVASGLAIAALGSDTGGSIRQPAAYCGCVGFKPSYGRVSRWGLGAYSSSLDVIGPITQNVEDASLLYDVISGADDRDSTSFRGDYVKTHPNLNPKRKLKIAVIKNYIDEASNEIKEALLKSVEELKKAGHEIVYKELSNSKFHVATYYILGTAEASANLNRFDGIRYGYRAPAKHLKEIYVNSRSEGFGAEVKRRLLLGTFVLSSGYYDAYYIKAQKARAFIKKEFDAILKECNLIFMPVTPTVAPKFDEKTDPLNSYLADIYTIGANLAGLPAISVPVAKNKDGLNISAQLIGAAYDEQCVLDGGLILENIKKGK